MNQSINHISSSTFLSHSSKIVNQSSRPFQIWYEESLLNNRSRAIRGMAHSREIPVLMNESLSQVFLSNAVYKYSFPNVLYLSTARTHKNI